MAIYRLVNVKSAGTATSRTVSLSNETEYDYGGYATLEFAPASDLTKKTTIYQFIDIQYKFSSTSGKWSISIWNSISHNKSGKGTAWTDADGIQWGTSSTGTSAKVMTFESIADSEKRKTAGRTVLRTGSTHTINSGSIAITPALLGVYWYTPSNSYHLVNTPNSSWSFPDGIFKATYKWDTGSTSYNAIWGNRAPAYSGTTPTRSPSIESGKVTLNCVDPSNLGVVTYSRGNVANTTKTTLFTFSGWDKDPSTTTIYKDTTFYAEFDSTSTWSPSSVLITAGNITKPSGYSFVGWNSDRYSSSAEYMEGSSVYIDVTGSDITKTLYAIWKPIEYIIQFNTGTQEILPDVTKIYNKNLTLPDPTPRNGYQFQGWNTLRDLSGKKYKGTLSEDLADKADVRINLYADWGKPIPNTFEYDLGEGTWGLTTPIESFNVEFRNFTLTTPKALDDTYTFIGWTASSSDWDKLHIEVPSSGYVSIVNIRPEEITSWGNNFKLTAHYARTNLYYRTEDGWQPVMEVYYNKQGNWVKLQDVLEANLGNIFYNVNGQWKSSN